jgi:hypothetical protein
MSVELKCEKVVKRSDGARDNQGRLRAWHGKCGAPAAQCEIVGPLSTAKAILCARHRKDAEDEIFVSDHGFAKGQVGDVPSGKKKHQQIPMPGIGVRVVE